MSASLDSVQTRSLPTIDSSQRPASPSDLEPAIISFFDTYRNRLLAYIMTFHICSYDTEEIVQEGFLSPFRHLQMRKSRKNIPAWMFRVAHSLALKHCFTNQRWWDSTESDGTIAEKQRDLRGWRTVSPRRPAFSKAFTIEPV